MFDYSQGNRVVHLKSDSKKAGKELTRQERLQKMLKEAQMNEVIHDMLDRVPRIVCFFRDDDI